MTNVIKMTKKIFTVGVVATTIVWSLGVAALVPTVANAATCPTLAAGDMVKVTGHSAIYVVDNNLKVRYFDNGDVFKSWRPTYGGYISISMDCLDSLGIPSAAPYGVAYHSGSYIVKRASSDQLYVVEPNNTLAKITPALATTLYGTGYKVMTITDQDWPNYPTRGADVTEAIAHPGMLIKNGSKTYYVSATGLQEVSETGMTANGFQTKFVRTVASSVIAGFSTGDAITAEVKALTDKSQSGGVTGGTITPTVTGAVTVSLAANTPATQSGMPIGSTNIDVLKFNVTNSGSSDMTIDEITLKRGGTGAVTGLTAYVYDGETRIGTGKTFASDSNEAVFSVMNKVVKAGTTLPLVVRLKVGATATTGNHTFSLSGMKLASGTVAGLPVTGNPMSVNSGITAGTITVDANGTLANPSIGDENVTLAQFKVTVGTEDVNVYSLTLKQDGTVDTALLSNFKLYQGATEIPSTVTVNGRYVTFALVNPFKIVNGNNKTFQVKGNISGTADAADTVVFYMSDSNDMKAVGASYGYGTLVDNALYNAANDNSLTTTLTLQGGNVTVSNKSEAAHDVKVDTTEDVLGKVGITAKADTIEIQQMVVTIATTRAASGQYYYGTIKTGAGQNYTATSTLLLRNIKLKDADTGRTIGSAKAVTDCGLTTSGDDNDTLTCTFTDYFNVAKGTTRNVSLVADVYSTQISGVIYTASFDFTAANFIVKDSKDVAVTGIVPATIIASNPVTTRSSALTISRATTPEARTIVKGADVDALGIIMTAGSGAGNDVKLTSLNLNVYVNSNTASDSTFTDATENSIAANTLVGIVGLYDGATKIAESSVDTSGNVVFDSNKFVGGFYTIPAGSSKTLIVRASVSGNAPYNSVDNAFSFDFAAADVTVESNGSTFTPTVTGTNINGTTGPTVWIGVTGYGTITTAADNSKPLAQLLTAGLAGEQEVHRIKLTATKETFTVDKLAVGLTTAASTYDDVEYLRLYDSNGVALTEPTSLNGTGTSTFSGLNIQVPIAGTTIIVKAKLTSIGERSTAEVATAGVGADTGDVLTFGLSTVTDEFHAVGVSGRVDTAANAAVSNSYQVVKSIPGFAVATLPSGVLAATNVVIYKFTVTAGANEDITLARVTPYITFSDSNGDNDLLMTANTLGVYDMDNAATPLNTLVGTNSTVSTTAAYPINFTTSSALVTIGKNTTKTFEIRANFSGVEASDSITVNFVQDSQAMTGVARTGDGATVTDSYKNFIWSDNGADTDGFTSTEWMNSFMIPKWDTKSLSVSKS